VWDTTLPCNISRSPVSLLVVSVSCHIPLPLPHFLVTDYQIENNKKKYFEVVCWFLCLFDPITFVVLKSNTLLFTLLQQARVLLARYAVTSQCHHTERPTYLGPTAINDMEKDPVTNSMRPEKIKEGRRQT
jgi:hypothetical protein